MMACPYCGPVEPRRTVFQIKRPSPGELVMDWCPKCTAVLKPDDVAKDFQNVNVDTETERIDLLAIRNDDAFLELPKMVRDRIDRRLNELGVPA